MEHHCIVCEQPAARQCSRCKAVVYCGVECQRRHWKDGGHKQVCRAADAALSKRDTPKVQTTPTETDQAARRMLAEHVSFCAREWRETLLPLAEYVVSGKSREWLVNTVAGIRVGPGDKCARLRDALVALAAHATTTVAAEELLMKLGGYVGLLPDDKMAMMGTPAVRDALVSLSRKLPSVEEAIVLVVASAIGKLAAGSQQRQALFATTAVRDMLTTFVPYTDSPVSMTVLAHTVRHLTVGVDAAAQQPKILFSTEAVRDALVALVQRTSEDHVVQEVMGVIGNIAFDPANDPRDLFATEAVRDALLSCARLATTPTTVDLFTVVMKGFTDAERHKDLFATEAVRDALVSVVPLATSALSSTCLVASMKNLITMTKPDLLLTAAVRDALVDLAPIATSMSNSAKARDGNVRNLACTIAAVIAMPPPSAEGLPTEATMARRMATRAATFGTTAVRDALVAVAPHATTPEAVETVASCFDFIANSSATVRAQFRTDAVKTALREMDRYASTFDSRDALRRSEETIFF